MLKKLQSLSHLIGNTPLLQLEDARLNLYCKLELHNLMGSVKVRPAYYILQEAINRGEIDEDTTVIESSSGNFAIALATLCKRLGIRFVPIIDPNINPSYERLLRSISSDVVKVTERDETGGFLLTRINTVYRMLEENPNTYWTNQYGNEDNFRAHYHGLGTELANHFEELDYAFVGVSSGGTISGVSRRLKDKFPDVKIIAVDTQGSVIFGDTPKKRYIPGIGSSIRPDVIDHALIDEIILVPEVETIDGCYELFERHGLFVGGSSGTSYKAIQNYFAKQTLNKRPNVVFLCPDGGMPYVDTVYNPEWVEWMRSESGTTQSVNK